jgi:hypothetical protein
MASGENNDVGPYVRLFLYYSISAPSNEFNICSDGLIGGFFPEIRHVLAAMGICHWNTLVPG